MTHPVANGGGYTNNGPSLNGKATPRLLTVPNRPTVEEKLR